MSGRVLITGASGFVGKNLLKTLPPDFDIFGTHHSNKKDFLHFLDITISKNVDEIFENVKPNIVIHTAALPNVNYCEENRTLAKKINLDGTKNIIRGCIREGAKLVFISTDYVFDGEDGPYSEDAQTNPLNYYGELKLQAEEEIKKNLGDYLIIRTTNIYGFDSESKNFVMFVLEKLESRLEVVVANDQYGNPTYVEDLSRAIKELIIKKKTGVYNVAGPDNISRVEFGQTVAEVWGFDLDLIRGKTTKELNQDARRPKRSGFIIDKIKRELDIEMHDTMKGLELMRDVSLLNQ
jgi:dTDP-4-dehydrorhamnose reductase